MQILFYGNQEKDSLDLFGEKLSNLITGPTKAATSPTTNPNTSNIQTKIFSELSFKNSQQHKLNQNLVFRINNDQPNEINHSIKNFYQVGLINDYKISSIFQIINLSLNQLFYYGASECLPNELPKEEDCEPKESRYDGIIAVFGDKIQNQVKNMKLFLVGK